MNYNFVNVYEEYLFDCTIVQNNDYLQLRMMSQLPGDRVVE